MDRFFGLSEAGTSVRREMLAGLSTFLTMSFIVAVNPMFLQDAGIPFAAGFVATVLATAFGTAIMGLWAKWPVAVAPGMGLNAYFAYGLVLGQQFSWQQALTAVFIASVLSLLFSLSRLRGWLIGAIPASLGAGITAGIGLFLAMDPDGYARGLQWMVPRSARDEFAVTQERVMTTLRKLLAGRLLGMAFEGVLTGIALMIGGVPMALLLGS